MILLTGATGYIGSNLWIELLKGPLPVLGLDNFSNSDPRTLEIIQKISGSPVTFIEGDIRDSNLLEELFLNNPITHIVHLAALKDVQESISKKEEYFDVNVRGFHNLLTVMRSHGCLKIIFSSSAAVYGDSAISPIAETAITSPSNYYGWTKLRGEQLLADEFNKLPSISSISLRYFNVAGQNESGLLYECAPRNSRSLFSKIEEVLRGNANKLPIFGDDWNTPDGTCIRDYLHVTDLANGHSAALNLLGGEQKCLVLNLGLGAGQSVYDVISTYEHSSGKAIPRYLDKRRLGDVGTSFADTHLASRLMGWSPAKTLSDICKDSYKSFSKYQR